MKITIQVEFSAEVPDNTTNISGITLNIDKCNMLDANGKFLGGKGGGYGLDSYKTTGVFSYRLLSAEERAGLFITI